MKDMEQYKNYGKIAFEKAFIKSIPNFDETKIFFNHKKDKTELHFIWNKKLHKFPIYRDSYHLDLWKNHFIDFLNTGEFDYNGYWKIYTGEDPNIDIEIGEVLKFKLCNNLGNYFYEHSNELSIYLENYRKTVDKDCGIKLVPKPL